MLTVGPMSNIKTFQLSLHADSRAKSFSVRNGKVKVSFGSAAGRPEVSEYDRIIDSGGLRCRSLRPAAIPTGRALLPIRTDTVSIDGNFFDLGDTSLQLPGVHASIRRFLPCEITVVDLFRHPGAPTKSAQ
jgi:Phosphopantetheine attachment site